LNHGNQNKQINSKRGILGNLNCREPGSRRNYEKPWKVSQKPTPIIEEKGKE